MNWSDMHVDFINAMVQAMYQYEARQVHVIELLTNAEMHDFYLSYCGT